MIPKRRLKVSKNGDNKFTYLGIKIPFYVCRKLNLQLMFRSVKKKTNLKNGFHIYSSNSKILKYFI